MEGSGSRSAFETVYAPVTVGHMFTGKAYFRAIRGQQLCAASVMSIVLEDNWNDLNLDEQKSLEESYESECPADQSTSFIAKNLIDLFVEKKENFKRESRTSALRLNYVRFISVVQEFIRAERTNNWPLHVAASKNMLNLFAAIGHNNYAKSCRLYLQSIKELKITQLDIYE